MSKPVSVLPTGSDPVTRDELAAILAAAGLSSDESLSLLADGVGAGGPFVGVIAGAYNEDQDGDTQSYSGSDTTIVLDEQAFDVGSPFLDPLGFWQGDGTFAVPAGAGGIYQVTAMLDYYVADYKGSDMVGIGPFINVNDSEPVPLVDGLQYFDPTNLGSHDLWPAVSGLLQLAAGDVVSVGAWGRVIHQGSPDLPVDFLIWCTSLFLVRVSAAS